MPWSALTKSRSALENSAEMKGNHCQLSPCDWFERILQMPGLIHVVPVPSNSEWADNYPRHHIAGVGARKAEGGKNIPRTRLPRKHWRFQSAAILPKVKGLEACSKEMQLDWCPQGVFYGHQKRLQPTVFWGVMGWPNLWRWAAK